MDSIDVTIDKGIDEAEADVRAALMDQGFGVLTEIDVTATLKAKLDVDRPPLRILGACNPGFANRALGIDESVSLLLPCNVVLSAAGPGRTTVSAVDPTALMDDPRFEDLASEVNTALAAALDTLR